MEELNVMMVSDDSLRGCILEHDFGKYYFYYLYISLYFIMYNFSFLCISEFPYDFIMCNVSFLCVSEYPHNFHPLRKDYLVAPECL